MGAGEAVPELAGIPFTGLFVPPLLDDCLVEGKLERFDVAVDAASMLLKALAVAHGVAAVLQPCHQLPPRVRHGRDAPAAGDGKQPAAKRLQFHFARGRRQPLRR